MSQLLLHKWFLKRLITIMDKPASFQLQNSSQTTTGFQLLKWPNKCSWHVLRSICTYLKVWCKITYIWQAVKPLWDGRKSCFNGIARKYPIALVYSVFTQLCFASLFLILLNPSAETASRHSSSQSLSLKGNYVCDWSTYISHLIPIF